ncbi:hypothetical protein [Microvirga arabica]|uniref:hypothetical protein n=1 Tax=Microvirga arabica TaxID=1128671 RepID=UPI0019397D64|nr:hypothetical protein [Microvirga arabica]MBM1172832.1 hypothetical protein [Microvirga arabica]
MTKRPSAAQLITERTARAAAAAVNEEAQEEALTTNFQASLPAPGLYDPGELDGRSLRATNRTHQFATRIKLETHKQMKRIVARDGITLGELIEKAIEAYEKERG